MMPSLGGGIMPKTQRIRDPIHDLIEFREGFEGYCWCVVQTPQFQRLRRIKQLGFSEFVYPGATHSRLAHSLGVFHTARQLLEVVERRQGHALDLRRSQTAQAAALVHDLGHGPFSHAFESVLKRLKLSRHESTSVRLIRETEVGDELNKFTPGFADKVADIISEKIPSDFYAAVVSSQFDADRLDYMRRDRLMTGTQSSGIDFSWLLANLEVGRISVGQDETLLNEVETLVVGPKAILAAEAYVVGLFHLYRTVYLHKTTRGLEKMFTELMMRVFQLTLDGSEQKTGLPSGHVLLRYVKDFNNLDLFQALDDGIVWGAMPFLADASDACVAELAKRISRRDLFKAVDITEGMKAKFPDPVPSQDKTINLLEEREKIQQKRRVFEAQIRERIKESDLLLSTDSAPRLLDDMATRDPYERQNDGAAALKTIYAASADGHYEDLVDISPVVGALKPYEAYRVYMRREDDKTRDKLALMMRG